MNILLTGTLWRYLTTSWRFVMFFLWPFLLSLVILGVAGLIVAAPLIAGFSAIHLIWSVPLAAFIATLLVRKLGDRFFMSYLLDDWSAAYDRIHGRNEKLNQRRKAFAEALKRKIEAAMRMKSSSSPIVWAPSPLSRPLPISSVNARIFWRESPCRCVPSVHA